ncbi:MAG TPA: DUF5134 domain-containing protein [Streptosporangiaceae bacterium]|nr:DUF5134 domain-containing protein [Streptosporangiaceae bacterium]
MMVPSWILDIFAAVMLVVAGVSAGRLAAGRAGSRFRPDADIDAAHVLMGIAMAGMLASSLRTLPNAVWIAVFAVVTVWFTWRVSAEVRTQGAAALGTGHHLPHLVHGTAMVYMFAAVTTAAHGSGMGMSGMAAGSAGMGTLKVPTLGLAFILFMVAWAVWDLDQIGNARLHARGRLPRLSVSPQPAAALAVAGPAASVLTSAGSATRHAASATAVTASGATAGEPASTSSVSTTEGTEAGPLLDPRVAVACRIAMGITMAFMLAIML